VPAEETVEGWRTVEGYALAFVKLKLVADAEDLVVWAVSMGQLELGSGSMLAFFGPAGGKDRGE
jgi:hypothetical protein